MSLREFPNVHQLLSGRTRTRTHVFSVLSLVHSSCLALSSFLPCDALTASPNSLCSWPPSVPLLMLFPPPSMSLHSTASRQTSTLPQALVKCLLSDSSFGHPLNQIYSVVTSTSWHAFSCLVNASLLCAQNWILEIWEMEDFRSLTSSYSQVDVTPCCKCTERLTPSYFI